jgi:VWFA-related protein
VIRPVRQLGAMILVSLAIVTVVTAQQRPPQQQPRGRFQSGVDVITMDVTVHDGNLAVGGLKPDDFLITDNGVAQTADTVSGNDLPIDMTMVIDASGSTEPFMDQIKRDTHEVTDMLRDDDQLRMLSFTSVIAQLSPHQSRSMPIDLDRTPPLGLTSIYDAVAAAMMRTRTPERHELIVVFTDGMDTSSTIGGPKVLDIARRSDAILHVFIVNPAPGGVPKPHPNRTRGYWWQFKGEGMEVSRIWLDDAATTTGGELQDIFGEAHVPGGLKTAINDMRTSYIVSYTARNVTRSGWHDIKVKLKRPGDFTIRARKGYFGGGK